MVLRSGSSEPHSVCSFGNNRFIRNGLRNPINTHDAACKPGVIKKKSANIPVAKEINNKGALLIRNGNQSINTK